jgi:type II secretory pathway pseudopilin PulG
VSGGRRRNTAGFSLVEAAMSIVLVAVMFAAVLQTVGAGRMSHYKTTGQRRGVLLGRQLLAEIQQHRYEDPDVPTVAPGLETGEGASDRMDFDDVDDFEGWFAQPPQDTDGSTEPDQDDWSREVSVDWVNPTNLEQASVTETKAKRIIVTVKHRGMVMSELTIIRTNAMPYVDR